MSDPILKEAIEALDELTSEERCEVFALYCVYCGDRQPEEGPSCQCWNDE